MASAEETPRGKPKLVTDWAISALIPTYFPIAKSGSATEDGEISTSRSAMIRQAKAWVKDEVMFPLFNEWIRLLTPPQPRLVFTKGGLQDPPVVKFKQDLLEQAEKGRITRAPENLVLGRLALKEEAAGKVRIFAIVDCWTQWMLHPLHQAIFALLRRIPQDGTFDQLAPVRLLGLRRDTFVASYDLSAATDRLPLIIQKMLLQRPLGLHLSEA